jgi:hypothetical protein
MNTSQKAKLSLDVILFGLFILAFLLDLTGLPLHQWVGLAGGLLAAYHLVTHWSWVKAVGARFFGRTSGRARLYYLVDAALLAGFGAILGSGLVISTWLDLPLTDYSAWSLAHVSASILTLGVAVLKLGLHWRWIANALKAPGRASLAGAALATAAPRSIGRREFLRVMGTVGATSLIALAASANGLKLPQVSAKSEDSATTITGSTAASKIQTVATSQVTTSSSQTTTSSSNASTTCALLCNKGCSYPGRCRRYTDSNGNGRCDLSECA